MNEEANCAEVITSDAGHGPVPAIRPALGGKDAPTDILTDDLMQHLFFDERGCEFRYNSFAKHWMRYDIGIWVRTEKAEVEDALAGWTRANLEALIDQYGPPTENGAWTDVHYRMFAKYSSDTGRAAILKMARRHSAVHVVPTEFDCDRHLLNTPTFVVDLATGDHQLHDPDYLMTRRTSVGPSKRATPRFDYFLDEITDGDDELKRFLQTFIGYCLTGEVKEHKLLFMWGSGGNGKGVLTTILREIMGSYAKVSNSQVLKRNAENRHTTEVAELVGSRVVIMNEVPADGMWSQQRLTSLTGGDTLSARFLYRDNFEFKPQFKLILVGNHRPVVQSPDPAFLRRMMLLRFNFTPAEPDPALLEKLRSEYGGILHWMIEGAVRYYQEGLVIPTKILDATKEYAGEEDDVAQWLEECCKRAEGEFTSSQALFESYKDWAENNGARPFRKRGLGERLATLGLQRDKTANLRGFSGIKLLPPEPSTA